MGIYANLPVDGNTIRLFVLHPSSDAAADIEFSLRQADLAASEGNYEALSYTWGELHSTRRIFMRRNGSRLPVNVRENLYNCLLRLRCVTRSRALWIDAICINQDDLTEKGSQITLMPHIYSGALRVLAWLGDAANLDEIFSISQNGHGTGTEAFFRRSYWERTWIVQELLNARVITFQCGSYSMSENRLSTMIFSQDGGLTGYRSRAQSLLEGKSRIKEHGDGGFSDLLARYSKSKCANKLDIVYALLGILPESSPALKIPVDYAATTTQLYIRAIDQIGAASSYTFGTAAERLRYALDLTWPNIIVAMQETGNRLDVSQCHVAQLSALLSRSAIVDECCLTGGDPTHKSALFYARDAINSYEPHVNFRKNLEADLRQQESSRFKAREQRLVWASHGSVRRGDLLLNCRAEDHSPDFALVFRLGSDTKWPCIGCAWKPMSPEADNTPSDSRIIREYILSSGLFLHAYLRVEWEETCLVRAPSRLFALTQAYKAGRYSTISQPTYREVMQAFPDSESYNQRVESYERMPAPSPSTPPQHIGRTNGPLSTDPSFSAKPRLRLIIATYLIPVQPIRTITWGILVAILAYRLLSWGVMMLWKVPIAIVAVVVMIRVAAAVTVVSVNCMVAVLFGVGLGLGRGDYCLVC